MLRLAAERLKRGWTQLHLAGLVGCARPRISDLEAGKTVPSPRRLTKLSAVLGVPQEELFKPVSDIEAVRCERAMWQAWLERQRLPRTGRAILRLAAERIHRGWTQAHLGQLVGMSGVLISMVETGRLVPFPVERTRLERVFGQPWETLGEPISD